LTDTSLKDLLIEAIRYGEMPETRARMEQVIDHALDTQHLKDLMARNALVENHMSLDDLYAIREDMDKAEARKLQPHFISAFFREAFRVVGGDLRDREARRFEVRMCPLTCWSATVSWGTPARRCSRNTSAFALTASNATSTASPRQTWYTPVTR
jgi:hypothetical protein